MGGEGIFFSTRHVISASEEYLVHCLLRINSVHLCVGCQVLLYACWSTLLAIPIEDCKPVLLSILLSKCCVIRYLSCPAVIVKLFGVYSCYHGGNLPPQM